MCKYKVPETVEIWPSILPFVDFKANYKLYTVMREFGISITDTRPNQSSTITLTSLIKGRNSRPITATTTKSAHGC